MTQAVDRYMLGELSPAESEAFEEHFFVCSECAEEVRIAVMFAENARAVFAEERSCAEPPRVVIEAPRKSWWDTLAAAWRQPAFAAPAFATILLLCFAGYQNLVEIPGLRGEMSRVDAAQVPVSFALRTAARGERADVEVPRGDPFFLLQFDPTWDKAVPVLESEVRDASGATVLTLVKPAPEPGKPMDLLIPTNRVKPGRGEVIVRDEVGGKPGAELSRYEFTLRYK